MLALLALPSAFAAPAADDAVEERLEGIAARRIIAIALHGDARGARPLAPLDHDERRRRVVAPLCVRDGRVARHRREGVALLRVLCRELG